MTTAEILESIVQKEREAATKAINRRLKKVEAQRDQANARCKELREHITKYQKTIAELREKLRGQS